MLTATSLAPAGVSWEPEASKTWIWARAVELPAVVSHVTVALTTSPGWHAWLVDSYAPPTPFARSTHRSASGPPAGTIDSMPFIPVHPGMVPSAAAGDVKDAFCTTSGVHEIAGVRA